MAVQSESDITMIKPVRGWRLPDLREVWQYRNVMFNFVGRNFRVTYRQTIGGPIYAVYQPFMTMIGYTLILGVLFDAQSDTSVPYPLFSFSALIIWTLFTGVVQGVSVSMQKNSTLIQKIYIPRLIFPLIETLMELLTFAIAMMILLLVMLLYGYLPTINVVILPVYTVLAAGTGLGVGLLFAGFQARFRDSVYLSQAVTRFLFFLTPVVYASSRLPAPLNELYQYNPMAVVVEAFRWALLGTGEAPSLSLTLLAFGIMFVLIWVGLLLFKRLEATIADVV
ncbi:MAG: ABC transporter permease [Chloroflexi bacterium]|nr:ABC transporter permease [Chloroflexota bacterium]